MKRKNTYRRALEGHPKAVRKLTRLGVPLPDDASSEAPGDARSCLAEYLGLELEALRLDLVDEDASDAIRDRMDPLWHRLTHPERDIAGIFKGQANQIAELRRKLAAAGGAEVSAEPLGVLGPWRPEEPDGNYTRRPVVGSLSMCVWKNGWGAGIVSSDLEAQGPETGGAGQHAADEWARTNGYVLLDAAPGSLSGELWPWRASCDRYHVAKWKGTGLSSDGRILIDDRCSGPYTGGWRVLVETSGVELIAELFMARGPQTGEEGKRFALAAAKALGLTVAPERPELIVLGPWTPLRGDLEGRNIVNGPNKNAAGLLRTPTGGPWSLLGFDGNVRVSEFTRGTREDADEAARAQGYVLIDAEPGSQRGELLPWWESCHGMSRVSRRQKPTYVVIQASRSWRIDAAGGKTLAWGPQTGEEGMRCADAAAYALGLTDAPPGAKVIWPEDEAKEAAAAVPETT